VTKLFSYIQLIRLNKPIGIWLFLWPTLWALWLAEGGVPPFKVILVFIAGVVVMRSLGCVINDLCDRNFDGQVKRTKNRPLIIGSVTPRQAIGLFFLLSILAGYLALQLNLLALLIAVVVFLLALFYPLTKRWTYFPQFFLGACVAGAVPMAFAMIQNQLPVQAGWVYLAALLWPVAYDTLYAMADRPDDIKIGIKSTALLWGSLDRFFLAILQVSIIGLLVVIGLVFSLTLPYYLSIGGAALLFTRQQILIKGREPAACFKAFLESHWVGLAVFIGIFLSDFIN
jgi:4-hydroxybenzoate polyprenyltransferase